MRQIFSERSTFSYRIKIIFVLFLSSLFLSPVVASCNSSKLEMYENPQSGLRLEKPHNWDLYYSERNGFTYLNADYGILNKDSTYIQIRGASCPQNSSIFANSIEEVEWNIQRIQNLYNLPSITVIQEPFTYKNSEYEVTKASIEVPAIVFEDDSDEDSTRNVDPNEGITIDLFRMINGENNSVWVEVRQGNNSDLNSQAQKIVDSIRIICPDVSY